MSSLSIIYATSTGHTEHVIETLQKHLAEKSPSLVLHVQRAETAGPEDLLAGDVLLLACGTWNTGGSEGQLHIHMDALLNSRAKDIDLQEKPCAIIALGDDRYYYSCRATEHLMQFVLRHNGRPLSTPLLIVNEPYGQEEKIQKWGEKLFVSFLAS
ncbi:MAG: flavodoxin domain-containing protein [Candidatus Peribacteraceae bacterium]|jgi:flavodoxin